MMHHLRMAVLATATALLFACSGGDSLQPLAPGDAVLAFGDSLTAGYGVAVEDAYPAVLEGNTGLNVVNAGISGEISADGLKRLPGVLATHKPRLVVLVHGGNDSLRRMSVQATEANLMQMVELIRNSGADAVMLGVPGANLTLSVPAYYERVAETHGVPIDVDILPFLERRPEFKSDRVHFNEEGYARMAAAVEQLLADNGALD